MGCTATLRIVKKHPNSSYSRILGRARSYRRSKTTVKESKVSLTVKISANDVAALRASINTVMRDISTIESVLAIKK